MNMSIKIIDANPKKKWGVFTIKGEININDFKETLYPSLDWWSLDDYRLQWQEGLRRLIDHDRSCLVATVDNPKLRKFIEWWLLYKIGDKVYIRNSIVLSDIYEEYIGDKPFTVDNCYDFIPGKGESYDEDGNKIAEWVVDWNCNRIDQQH